MRTGLAIAILVAVTACATAEKTEWQRADGTPGDAEQLQQAQHDCLSIVGAPAPQSQAPMVSTRYQMIDCMRMKGWVKQ